MKLRNIAVFASALTTLALVTSGAVGSNYILNFKMRDVDVIRRREIKAKRLDEKAYQALNPKKVSIESKNGYHINAEIIKKYPHNHWMIFCHGVTENSITSIKYMNLFLELGYNGVIFDHRRHGSSGGKFSTYGYFEKHDLESVISYLKETYGFDLKFGVHGESMGAATMLLYAGELANEAEFYISDCSFSSFEKVLTHIIGQKLQIGSGFLLKFINIFLRIRSRFSLYAVSPIKVVQNIEQPILFIHSKPDLFIPYTHSVDLYNKKVGPKRKWYPEYGGHASSFNVNPVTYRKKVKNFLTEFNLLPQD
ncbi:alpha/beta hydrolase [Macrococcus brunensis]|uniref:Alpha/beta hydrolase n=1 Tax=Macrococcus brunensis TaxID=198483 RepID=A0A4R6BDJ9_9STAP|nr:alpha/beta hydrolase [Macrococcus brunensis]TDL97847.1 alpha/beta hydrolase [Macrococcus brunensis]ULG73391.1 alpha/beta hydrolase [Macrococcus brunensis]